MKRKTREFIVFESGNKMKVDTAHIYALQEHIQEQGDKVTPGTNVYFDFGIIIFVKEGYQELIDEIFGAEEDRTFFAGVNTPPPSGPPTPAN